MGGTLCGAAAVLSAKLAFCAAAAGRCRRVATPPRKRPRAMPPCGRGALRSLAGRSRWCGARIGRSPCRPLRPPRSARPLVRVPPPRATHFVASPPPLSPPRGSCRPRKGRAGFFLRLSAPWRRSRARAHGRRVSRPFCLRYRCHSQQRKTRSGSVCVHAAKPCFSRCPCGSFRVAVSCSAGRVPSALRFMAASVSPPDHAKKGAQIIENRAFSTICPAKL